MSRQETLIRWLAKGWIRDDRVPLEGLAAVPAVVSIAGVSLRVDTVLWRDFQPISPPDGQPLIAAALVQAVGSMALPEGLVAKRIAIVHERTAWVAPVLEEHRREQGESRFEVIARTGPKWGPGVAVDVILQLQDAEGRTYLLRAANQMIKRTD